MANLSNTSIGMGIGQGITQGIQNAGQIYGLMEQKRRGEQEDERMVQERERMVQERRLAPLKEESLRLGNELARANVDETILKLKELQKANARVHWPSFSSPAGNDPVKSVAANQLERAARELGYMDEDGFIEFQNIGRVAAFVNSPEKSKERALETIDAIDARLSNINKADPNYANLMAAKTRIEKLYGMREAPNEETYWDENKKDWITVDKNTSRVIREGATPVAVKQAQIVAEASKERKTPVIQHVDLGNVMVTYRDGVEIKREPKGKVPGDEKPDPYVRMAISSELRAAEESHERKLKALSDELEDPLNEENKGVIQGRINKENLRWDQQRKEFNATLRLGTRLGVGAVPPPPVSPVAPAIAAPAGKQALPKPRENEIRQET